MLGHTDIRTTQIYAKVIDTKLSNDMELLAQKSISKALLLYNRTGTGHKL